MAIVTQSELKNLPKSYPDLKNTRVTAKVKLAGNNIDFVSLVVDQAYSNHHAYVIKIDTSLSQNMFLVDVYEKMELMGRVVAINFSSFDKDSNPYTVKGLVTGVEFEGLHGKNKYLIIKAQSPTILLERGRKYVAYEDTSASNLLRRVFNQQHNIMGVLEYVNAEMPDTPLEFAMQYNESDWEFLNRVCYQNGQNIYFSGSQLILGNKPERDWEMVTLTYDKEITRLNFSTNIQPLSFTHYTYSPYRDDRLSSSSNAKCTNVSDYLNVVKDKSQILNADTPPDIVSSIPDLDAGTLGELAEAEVSRRAGEAIYVSGTSTNYWSTIGRPLKILKQNGSALGTFRVIKSRHVIDENGEYSCHFEAILLKLAVVPVDAPQTPAMMAAPMLATVVNTDDPEGMGRVQVKFQFNEGRCRAWLRVQTADAGLTADGTKNRGLVLIPEKGTQVIVSFLMGNTNYPYISGALYHKKNADISKEGNYIKSFTSLTGLSVVFDDSKEKLGITIHDTTGEVVQIDAKNKAINITATEAINLQAKNITINATEKLTLQGVKIEEHSKEHQVLTEGLYSAEANTQTLKSNTYKQSATSSLEIVAGSTADIKGSKVNIDSGGNAQSPKAPLAARDMIVSSYVPQSLLESEIVPEEDIVEEQGKNPQIISVKLFDDDGNETEYLSLSSNVEVETKDMAGKKLELKLKDDETQDIVYIGDFFIPSNDYIVKSIIRKKDRHMSDNEESL